MDFLAENYIWLIVIGVFILMVIIGYFADKKQNSDKNKSKLKDHVDELDEKNNEPEVEIAEWGDTPVPKEEDEVIEVKGLDNSFDSWDEKLEETTNEETNDVPKEDMETGNEEANVENEPVSDESSVNENSVEETPVEDDFGFNEVPETNVENESASDESSVNENSVEETPVEETTTETENNSVEQIPEVDNTATTEEPEEIKEDSIEDLEITLPNMDTLNEEIKDVVDAEDVWKF